MAYIPVVVDFTSSPLPESGDDFVIAKNIGFQAQSVAVDNYTAYWIYFPGADAYAPPFWGGIILSLGHTSDYAYAKLLSPFTGSAQAPTDPSYQLHTVWSDQVVPFNAGQQIAGTGGVGPPPFIVNITPDDFKLEFLSTIIIITNVAQPIPTAALTDRTSLLLQAPFDNTDIVYVGGMGVTADETATGGIQIGPGQSCPVETDGAIIYAIAAVPSQKLIVCEGK